MLNGHGDDAHLYKTKVVSNFSSNVYAHFDWSGLETYLCEHISLIHSYPEPDAISLRRQLSEIYAIKEDEICVTNGAIEAIYLIAQAFRGRHSAIVVPTFSEYEDACRIHNHTLSFVERFDDLSDDVELVWLCNPNNPTGKIYDKEYLLEVVKQYPQRWFVFDHSYASFTGQEVILPQECIGLNNLILLHSMTKSYAIPGLRLGYITASKKLLNKVKQYSMPWSVNTIALAAGKYLLKEDKPNFESLIIESRRVQNELEKIEGLTFLSSPMHFFLCRLEEGRAADLKEYLVNNWGILIRDASNFRGLDHRYFRIAVQSPKENDLLITAMEEWIALDS